MHILSKNGNRKHNLRSHGQRAVKALYNVYKLSKLYERIINDRKKYGRQYTVAVTMGIAPEINYIKS